MNALMDAGIPDPRPLHVQVEDARESRGWTQEELAERANVPLRTYSSFANGHTRMQARGLARVLAALDMTSDLQQLETREATLEGFPADIQVFTDTVAAFLSTMPEAERRAFINDTIRRIVAYRS
jgi:transcriptional regulator with XRE-family HTH domain